MPGKGGFFCVFVKTFFINQAYNIRKAEQKKVNDARTVVLKEENRSLEQSIREKEAQMQQMFGIFAAHARVNPNIALEPDIQVGDIFLTDRCSLGCSTDSFLIN